MQDEILGALRWKTCAAPEQPARKVLNLPGVTNNFGTRGPSGTATNEDGQYDLPGIPCL
jgi:hypothetical protein